MSLNKEELQDTFALQALPSLHGCTQMKDLVKMKQECGWHLEVNEKNLTPNHVYCYLKIPAPKL